MTLLPCVLWGWRTCESVSWWKLRHSTRSVIGQAFVGRFATWYQRWVVNRILKRRANTQSSSVAGRNRFAGLVCRNDRRNRSVLTINGSDYHSPRFLLANASLFDVFLPWQRRDAHKSLSCALLTCSLMVLIASFLRRWPLSDRLYHDFVNTLYYIYL